MKKLVFIIALTTCTYITASAQKGDIHIGAGVDIGLPIGNFGDGYGIGFGASAKGLYGISEAGQVTLTLGFLRFGMKDDSDLVSGSTTLIPFLPGYRHRFGNLYAEGQVGLTVLRTSIKFEDNDYGLGNLAGSSSATHLGYGIGGGYLIGPWDLGLRFQGVSGTGGSLDFIGAKIAYNFQLN
ncbi:hypothetical protein [Parapedobacter soli]|uniref:hypothetical protein n=1 Tax=Parapedobacter soli TaxID=416955 RepID=UPI0021C75442|nr:hypothetical protein [Parapedobacter soli]